MVQEEDDDEDDEDKDVAMLDDDDDDEDDSQAMFFKDKSKGASTLERSLCPFLPELAKQRQFDRGTV